MGHFVYRIEGIPLLWDNRTTVKYFQQASDQISHHAIISAGEPSVLEKVQNYKPLQTYAQALQKSFEDPHMTLANVMLTGKPLQEKIFSLDVETQFKIAGKLHTHKHIVTRDSAGLLVVLRTPYHGDYVILTKEARPAIGLNEALAVPAGQIEDGEEPNAAALREFTEETGIWPKELKALGRLQEYEDKLGYVDPGMRSSKSYGIIHIYVADDYACLKQFNDRHGLDDEAEKTRSVVMPLNNDTIQTVTCDSSRSLLRYAQNILLQDVLQRREQDIRALRMERSFRPSNP